MGSPSGAQCIGKTNVVQMYQYKGIDTWAIFNGKQFIHAGDSVELEPFLTMLDNGGTTGYTLKLYRDVDDPDTITDKTECNGSFNFRLMGRTSAERGGVSGYLPGGTSVIDEVTKKISGIISDQVTEVIEEKFNGSQEPARESLGDIVLGYLQDPQKMQMAIGFVNGLRGMFAPAGFSPMPAALSGANMPAAPMPPPRRAGVAVGSVADAPDDNPEKLRLVTAIDRLGRVDPDIITTLERLADLAETNKQMYDYAKGMLPPKK